MEDHIGRPLSLYVYNNEYNVTREVTIHPSKGWGGEGALGCTLGYGALHRLPAPLSEPVAGPGEVMFEGEVAKFSNEENRAYTTQQNDSGESLVAATNAQIDASNFLVPANVISPPPMSGPPMGGGGGKKKRTNVKGGGLDDYFNEGEKKSRELDHAPSAKSTPPPPPPKGGPPSSISPAPEKQEEKEQA